VRSLKGLTGITSDTDRVGLVYLKNAGPI